MWQRRIRQARPRIWLDESRLALLRAKVEGKSLEEIKAMAGTAIPALALVYVLTGDKASARQAVTEALAFGKTTNWIYLRTAALCYDWCHPVLSPEEKAWFREVFISEGLKQLANRRTWRSFHYTFYLFASELGLSAIALGEEEPFAQYVLDFLKSRYRDAMRVFDDIFADGEWGEGFDLNRVATGCALRFLWALKTASGEDLMSASAHLKNASQYIMYGSKPNGRVYPGQDNDRPVLSDRDREMLLMLAAEFNDPYAQFVLNHCRVKTFWGGRHFLWHDLLWHDPSIPERPLDDIPRSRIFRGQGLVTARSGWGWDQEEKRLPVSWVSFRCGSYYGQNTHYDNNHFEIYYKGELAIDSGRFDDDWGMERSPREVRKSQLFNYYKRSIAHNTILVYDDREEMAMGVVNDGGQEELLYVGGVRNEPENFDAREYSLEAERMSYDWAKTADRWHTGRMLAYAGNNLFTYACGDAAKSYSPRKLDSFVRQFLYVQPDLVIVFDRVVSADAAFRKTWLLHSIIEPRVHGEKSFEIVYNGGRLVCIPVLPEQRTIDKIGGHGKEFLVGGIHYACGPKASSGRRSPLNFGELPGAWRIEECPLTPSEEDYFLNVILLTDKESKTTPEVTREDGDEMSFTVSVALPYQRRVNVSFARGPKPAARLLIEEHGRLLFEGLMPETVVLEKGRI